LLVEFYDLREDGFRPRGLFDRLQALPRSPAGTILVFPQEWSIRHN